MIHCHINKEKLLTLKFNPRDYILLSQVFYDAIMKNVDTKNCDHKYLKVLFDGTNQFAHYYACKYCGTTELDPYNIHYPNKDKLIQRYKNGLL